MFWKFNYNINDKHRLLNGYHDDFYWIPGTTSAFTAPSTINLSHGHNPTPNLVYTGVLTSRTLVEARYSGFWLQSSNDPNEDGQPRIGTRYTDDVTSLVTGAITQWTENRSFRYGVQGKLSHYADDFLGGSHDLKIGLQYGTNGNVNLNGPNDTVRTLAAGRRIGTTQLSYYQGTRAKTYGTYVDDTFRLGDRTTLNMGLRYDYSQGFYPRSMSIPKAYLWPGASLFVGGMAVALNGFLNNQNGEFPGFDEANSTNVKMGAAGLAAAFGGGVLLFLGKQKAGHAPSLTFGRARITVAQHVRW